MYITIHFVLTTGYIFRFFRVQVLVKRIFEQLHKICPINIIFVLLLKSLFLFQFFSIFFFYPSQLHENVVFLYTRTLFYSHDNIIYIHAYEYYYINKFFGFGSLKDLFAPRIYKYNINYSYCSYAAERTLYNIIYHFACIISYCNNYICIYSLKIIYH